MEKAEEAHCVEHAAQKARKETKTKAREKAKKQRIAEEEEKKKWIEYLQQLWDKILVENTVLLEGTGGSQVIGTKCKKVNSEDEEEQWSFKKAKEKKLEKYHGNTRVKIGGDNLCKRYMHARQDCLVYNSK